MTALTAWFVASAAIASGSARAADTAGTRSAAELLRDLGNLEVVGSVLYVAAHPDDENTQLIGWFEGHGVRAAYLSMTRGDGGQNRVGAEQDELLGVLRTGELLAARALDGGEQRFTRARDFGYSKSADEALALWGHDAILDDVVRAIRSFEPDTVITRFPTTGETHGHHLASAILAGEAFALAGDPAYVTPGLAPWRPARLFHNRSSWNLEPDTDKTGWIAIDTGGYDALLGRGYGERAAAARSAHKSQGFGAAPEVGPDIEYLVPLAGDPVPPSSVDASATDLPGWFDATWARFPGTKALAKAIARAADRFDVREVHAALPRLAEVHARLDTVPDPVWREAKRADVEGLMLDAAGLWLTVRAERPAVAPSGALPVQVDVLVRAPADVTLRGIHWSTGQETTVSDPRPLQAHAPWNLGLTLIVPADAPLTRPHWLIAPSTRARYTVDDPALRDAPDTPPSLYADLALTVAGRPLTARVPVLYSVTDPVAGEQLRPVEVLPPVTATFDAPAAMLVGAAPATSRLTLRATSGPASGALALAAPPGMTVSPSALAYALTDAAPEQIVALTVTAAPGASPGPLVAELDGVEAYGEQRLDQPHVPRRTVLSPARQALAPVDLQRGPTERIGYVEGPGDEVAGALARVGYEVETLSDDAIAAGDLQGFDAIVVGIRAFNTRPRLRALHAPLMAYVAGGGRLVVQYNTNNRFDPLDGPIGPAPFTIGRGRVTEEDAALAPLDPASPALVAPNRLVPADFDGWVQERGLYFAETWDPAYTPVFASHDAGEEPLLGSLLVARHGRGVFVYTGLAFFRQLPAGVPGAYRLLANVLALPASALPIDAAAP